MRRVTACATCLLVCSAALGRAEDRTQSSTHEQLKQAQREYRQAIKAASADKSLEAVQRLELAASLVEKYQAPLELARQRAVSEDIQCGKLAMLQGRALEAIAKFQEALELDPHNEYARQELQRSMLPVFGSEPKIVERTGEEIRITPELTPQSFHLSDASPAIIRKVCAAYGIKASVDESSSGKYLQFDLDRVSWDTAMRIVMRMAKTSWTPLSEKVVFVFADTEANRRRYERSFLRTFYLPDSLGSESLNEIATVLRTMLDVRTAVVDEPTNSISVRANAETMKSASQLITELVNRQPQVMLDVEMYQVSSSFLRSLGVTLPTQFQISYIPSSGAASVVTEVLSSLGFSTRRFELTVPPASVTASESRSQVRTLDTATLRSAQGQPGVLTLGQRYPIVASTYSSVMSGQPLQMPTPNVTYVDVGLRLKTTPFIHRDGTVGLQLSLQLSAIGTRAMNGMPEILNTEYSGFVTAMDGEPIIAAGNIMQTSSNTSSGWPGFAAIPGLGPLFSTRSKQANDDQLLIVIVPHIVSPAEKS